MKKYLFTALVSTLFFSAIAQQNDKRITALEPQLQQILKDWNAPGFAVAVVQKNKVIYAKGFGYRDVEKKLPVTPNTLFAIGSCTKAFTASLIGLLDKEKKVELDKPVHNYLPQLSFYNDALTDQVTLRDMMTHRTGLPRHDLSWYFFDTPSRDSLLQRIRYMEPSAGLRNTWQYNNWMFMLQGMVVEKITGKSWEQNVSEKIFQPLGMSRSNFSVKQLAADADAATGYGLKFDSILQKLPYYNISGMGPAGSINSSVNEMANWLNTWIHAGKFNDREILPEPFARTAMSSQMVIAPAVPDSANPDIYFANYGLGWFLSSYRGHYRVEHGGNIDGFSASTAFYPTDSIGIVVLTNQNGSTVPSIVRNIITDRLLNLPYKDWSKQLKQSRDKAKAAEKAAIATATDQRKKGTTPSHSMKDYEGLYSNPGYGTIDVYLKNDSLFARTGSKTVWLRHYHYDIFEPLMVEEDGIDTSGAPMKFQFEMDVNGDIHSLASAFEPSLKPLEFVKKAKEVQVGAGELEKYVGEYELPGVVAKVYTKGNTLYLFVPGQPEYELAANGDDKFSLKILSGYSLQFHPGENGRIQAVSFIQPNGTFKAVKK
ncbi:MAG: serine hydrolase [Flavisolibacter sp.]